MASIKEYNRKLSSLKNTVKITKTMKMVSASKLRRAQEAENRAKDYAHEVNNLIYRVAGSVEEEMHPLLMPHAEAKKVLLLVFSSDKGLCGGFNNTLIKHVERQCTALEAEGKEVSMAFCGRRGFLHFGKRAPVFKNYAGVTAAPNSRDAAEIAEELEAAFVNGDIDEVHMIYNHFVSPLSQVPQMDRLMPLPMSTLEDHDQVDEIREDDFISEPPLSELLERLIPRLVVFKVFYALLENAAGEHGARMTAMDNATTNANKMIDEYTLLRNRARQAAITTELIEIISGAEAL
ncbi:ATP synthase F1 subunit gamma [Pontiella agarivorans]|uniref:ATP synthase gamma chain n=1 Tax=Pontiella agarivorans TaxID=3038953 RepID=A0ABU5MWR7_9BACT|nr:ATP synthase F1 subunit gamma [Pontiella agarivorans]MDZ8118638.1 ATP synthase F1 subunit gamma [Pontiella agarivorans]